MPMQSELDAAELKQKTKSLLGEIAGHDKVLRSQKLRPLESSYAEVAVKLRDACERLLLLNFEFASSKDIDVLLWQRCFYRPIEEYRRSVRKLLGKISKQEQAGVTPSSQSSGDPVASSSENIASLQQLLASTRKSFQTVIQEASDFYTHLLSRFRETFDVDTSTILLQGAVPEAKGQYYIACHRMLVYKGDLARYLDATFPDGDKTFKEAHKWYAKAATLVGSIGTPHNQLAVIAAMRGHELEAMYRYYRSLALEQPFVTSRDNLLTFFEKNRLAVLDFVPPEQLGGLAVPGPGGSKGKGKSKANGKGEKKHSLVQRARLLYIRLHGIIFTRTSIEQFDAVQKKFITVLQKVTRVPDTLDSPDSGHDHFASTDAWYMMTSLVYLIHSLDHPVASKKGDTVGQTFTQKSQVAPLKRLLVGLALTMGKVMMKSTTFAIRRAIERDEVIQPTTLTYLPALTIMSQYMTTHIPLFFHSRDECHAKPREHFVKSIAALLSAVLADATRCAPIDPGLLSSPWLCPPEQVDLLNFAPLHEEQEKLKSGMGSGRRPEILSRVPASTLHDIAHRRRLVLVLDLGVALTSPTGHADDNDSEKKVFLYHRQGVFQTQPFQEQHTASTATLVAPVDRVTPAPVPTSTTAPAPAIQNPTSTVTAPTTSTTSAPLWHVPPYPSTVLEASASQQQSAQPMPPTPAPWPSILPTTTPVPQPTRPGYEAQQQQQQVWSPATATTGMPTWGTGHTATFAHSTSGHVSGEYSLFSFPPVDANDTWMPNPTAVAANNSATTGATTATTTTAAASGSTGSGSGSTAVPASSPVTTSSGAPVLNPFAPTPTPAPAPDAQAPSQTGMFDWLTGGATASSQWVSLEPEGKEEIEPAG